MKSKNQPPTPEQIAGILKMLNLTHDCELTCGECLQNVSEYAERQLADQPVDEVIAGVEHHLALCQDCREEYHALLKILKTTRAEPQGDSPTTPK